jgi:hypothetical protein
MGQRQSSCRSGCRAETIAAIKRAAREQVASSGAENLSLGVLALAFTMWIRADGLVWQELHGHLPGTLFGDGAFYEMESRVLMERLGLIAA